MCKIADTSQVSVSLRNIELVPAAEIAQFEITVDGTSDSELAVAIKGNLKENAQFFILFFIHFSILYPQKLFSLYRPYIQLACQSIGWCAQYVYSRIHTA